MKGLMMLFLAVTSVAALAAPQPKNDLTQGAENTLICASFPCKNDGECKNVGCFRCQAGYLNSTMRESIFFWKPEQEHGYLGQWWPSPFTVPGPDGSPPLAYQNCEHYMMHQKGVLFAPDDPITHEILAPSGPVPSPKELKALGRKVPNFDDEVWQRERLGIVVRANYYKFSQHADLKALLLGTGDCELVEASPRDRIWGVGFGAKNAPARRDRWGLNLLGKALMEVRQMLRDEQL